MLKSVNPACLQNNYPQQQKDGYSLFYVNLFKKYILMSSNDIHLFYGSSFNMIKTIGVDFTMTSAFWNSMEFREVCKKIQSNLMKLFPIRLKIVCSDIKKAERGFMILKQFVITSQIVDLCTLLNSRQLRLDIKKGILLFHLF